MSFCVGVFVSEYLVGRQGQPGETGANSIPDRVVVRRGAVAVPIPTSLLLASVLSCPWVAWEPRQLEDYWPLLDVQAL